MTFTYVTENICQCYGVSLQNQRLIKVRKLKDVSDDKNVIYKVCPMEIILGKSQLCHMTEFAGAEDKNYLMEIQFCLK